MNAHNPHSQNVVGDVVIPDGGGEIVLLPRLWDFQLVAGDGTTLMQTHDGLTATLGFVNDSIVVEWVAENAGRAENPDFVEHFYRRAS